MKTLALLTSSAILAASSLATATINITYSTGAWDHISAHSEVQVKWETAQTLVYFSPHPLPPYLSCSNPLSSNKIAGGWLFVLIKALQDLSLSLIKQESNTHKWPLGHSLVVTRLSKLRLPAGEAEFAFWDIPKVDFKG